MARMPVIDRQKCDGCGLCVSVCHCNILVLVDDVVTIIEKKKCASCNRWCSQCELICPTGAIYCPFDIVIEER